MLQAGVEMFRLVGLHAFQRHPGFPDQLIVGQLVLVTDGQPAHRGEGSAWLKGYRAKQYVIIFNVSNSH